MNRRRGVRILGAVVLLTALLWASREWSLVGPVRETSSESTTAPPAVESDALARAFRERQSGVLVSGRGVVERTLSDDTEGSRHQRFIVRLDSGQTVLVSHNIDVADRIDGLRAGDPVAFAGEYEWNERGGVVHWTHHDPAGRHTGGWLEHEGRRYE